MAASARKLVTFLAPLIFAAGLAHLGYQIWKHWDVVTLDFRFFWLAGEFWLRGENPYGPAYAIAADAQFAVSRGAIWYYTPNWLPVAALLSLPDALNASRLWLVANAAMLVAGAVVNESAFRRLPAASSLIDPGAPFAGFLNSLPRGTLFFLFAGAAALAQATGNTLHLGQSSMLIYFGASLLLFGAARRGLVAAAAGLAILMLKPQIGALICAGLVFTPFGRRAILVAAIISIAAAAPAFLMTPPVELLAALAGGVSQYTDQSYNMPPAVTGLRHLAWIAGAADFGSAFYLLLALAFIAAAGLAAQRRPRPARTMDFAVMAIAVAAMTSPLHVYDFTLIAAIALYAIALPGVSGAVSLAALALGWRAGNLPHPVSLAADGVTYYPGSAYASVAAIAIAAAIISRIVNTPGRPSPVQSGA
jgi:hypothetical protein